MKHGSWKEQIQTASTSLTKEIRTNVPLGLWIVPNWCRSLKNTMQKLRDGMAKAKKTQCIFLAFAPRFLSFWNMLSNILKFKRLPPLKIHLKFFYANNRISVNPFPGLLEAFLTYTGTNRPTPWGCWWACIHLLLPSYYLLLLSLLLHHPPFWHFVSRGRHTSHNK